MRILIPRSPLKAPFFCWHKLQVVKPVGLANSCFLNVFLNKNVDFGKMCGSEG